MSSAAQTAANQANAQLSTGPRTEEGKQISSRNALKHGLTAATVLIPGEDPVEYETFRNGLLGFWKPEGAAEIALVDELISAQWRLKRCERLEASILSAEVPDFKALNHLSLHASRLKRLFSAGMKDLAGLQKVRLEDRDRRFHQALRIRSHDLSSNRQTDLKEIGFDFEIEEIDRQIRRDKRLASANLAWITG